MQTDMPQCFSHRQPVGIRWWPVGVILGVMVVAMGVLTLLILEKYPDNENGPSHTGKS